MVHCIPVVLFNKKALSQWKGKPKSAAFSGEALHADLPAMFFDNFGTDIKPESKTRVLAALLIRPVLPVEQVGLFFPDDTGTLVSHRDPDGVR